MEKIEGTPFTIINQENVWFIVMGNYRITEPTETKDEQIGKLRSEKWLITMHMIIICIKKQLENPVIQEMDNIEKENAHVQIEETDKKWESPRDRENRTRQQYNPIT